MTRVWLLLMLITLTAMAPAASSQADDPLDPADAPVSVRRAVFRAEQAVRDGDLEEASRILSAALEGGGDRDHPAIHYRLGAYLLELERPVEALEQLRAASRQAPTSAAVWRDLARAAYENGFFAEAAAAFAEAARHGSAAQAGELRYYGGVAWILAEEPARAVDVLAPLVADNPDTVPVAWTRALISAAMDAGTPASAEAGADRLLREHASDPDAWQLASQLAQVAGDLPLAATRLQVAAWLADLPDQEQRRLAELQGAAGAPRQAARTYARLWDQGRGDPLLAEPLAVSWLRAHEPDSARVVLTAAVATEPTSRRFMLLGDLEYGAERYEAAARAYAAATGLDPDLGRGWLMQGAAEVQVGRLDAARQHLQRALQDPGVADQARRLLAQIERPAP